LLNDSGGALSMTAATSTGGDPATHQHSMVREITVTFASAVDSSLLSGFTNNTLTFGNNDNIFGGAIAIDRLQGPGSLAAYTFGATASISSDHTVLKITFDTDNSNIFGGSLADGNYSFRLLGSQGPQTITFWRLFGDADGTRKVEKGTTGSTTTDQDRFSS